MSLYLDTKYLNLVKSKLDLFKKTNNNTYVCRCCICGDSKKDKTKTRMYFYSVDNGIRVYCHNCHYSNSLLYFLRDIDQCLYKQYLFESLRDKQTNTDINNQQLLTESLNNLRSSKSICNITLDRIKDDIVRVDKLDDDHCCKKYVNSRLIPKDKHHLLYYTDHFQSLINKLIPGKFSTGIDEKRLIIPYFDKRGTLFALQGRALDSKARIRYYTIKFDQTRENVYGLDRVDTSKTIYCTEGPIDSLFLPNSIAVSGSSYNDDIINKLKNNIVIVPDNEKRNAGVMAQVGSMIDKGFKVVLWPNNTSFKDVNEAIVSGIASDQLVEIINNNTVCGFTGMIKFKLWVGER